MICFLLRRCLIACWLLTIYKWSSIRLFACIQIAVLFVCRSIRERKTNPSPKPCFILLPPPPSPSTKVLTFHPIPTIPSSSFNTLNPSNPSYVRVNRILVDHRRSLAECIDYSKSFEIGYRTRIRGGVTKDTL